MSRRAKKIEKRVTVDPKFNSELIAHVIRVIMKDGKKTTAERIVYGAVEKIKEAVEKDPSKFEKGEGDQKAVVTDPLEIISQAIENMKPKVEVKTWAAPPTRSRWRSTRSASARSRSAG